jgi:hypothetical protein
MDYPIKNVTDIPNLEDIAKKIWLEILCSKDLAPYIEDWARERLEKELAKGKLTDHREIEFKKRIEDYTLSCSVSLISGAWRWEGEVFTDEVTGNIYSVYNDFIFNFGNSCYSSMSSIIAEEHIKLSSLVFSCVTEFVKPYRNMQTKILISTKEQELKIKEEYEKAKIDNALRELKNKLLKDIPEKTKGMRVSYSVSAQITYPKIDGVGACDFELGIKKKTYRCWVYDGVAETKVTIYRKE